MIKAILFNIHMSVNLPINTTKFGHAKITAHQNFVISLLFLRSITIMYTLSALLVHPSPPVETCHNNHHHHHHHHIDLNTHPHTFQSTKNQQPAKKRKKRLPPLYHPDNFTLKDDILPLPHQPGLLLRLVLALAICEAHPEKQ